MLSCWLLLCKLWKTADEALHFFAYTRTEDEKGVTIPSQRRWVQYFETILAAPRPQRTLTMKRLVFHTLPRLDGCFLFYFVLVCYFFLFFFDYLFYFLHLVVLVFSREIYCFFNNCTYFTKQC
jgi:hypothetical protein